MNVTVIGGSGYVGFITGLGLAELGHSVVNVDINEQRVRMMNGGESPIHEQDVDLSAALARSLERKTIRFTTRLEDGVRHGDVIFVAVGTPQKDGGDADLSQVIGVAKDITQYIDGYKVLVVKSTVPVGTVELVCSILGAKKREGEDFDIVSNPEFLREGRGLYDFYNPTRIVVGTGSERARAVMQALYQPFLASDNENATTADTTFPLRRGTPLVETSIASAQMIKYASNAFLATRISYINEIALICERVGADVLEVARGMGYDDRIGPQYLQAGVGFGGPCLEKDLSALIRIAEASGYEPGVLRGVLEKNEAQLRSIVMKLRNLVGYLLYGKEIAVFGLAFKPGTNDVRTSLSLRIIDLLTQEGARVRAYDPIAVPEARELRPSIDFFDDPYQAAADAHAILILTDWSQFRDLDYGRIGQSMGSACIVDGCNTLRDLALQEAGFRYVGVGRAAV